MRKRRNIWVLGVAACALLATSCGTEEPTPGPTPTPETYKLTVNSDSGVESVKITADGTEVTDLTRIEEGTELTAVIDLKDDYEISAVTLNGDAVSATGGSYVFDMPSEDATLAVTTSEVAPEVSTITVTNDGTKGTYTLTKGDAAVTDGKVNVGDTVKLTVTPNTGYTVASVTLDGTALTLTDGAYSFTASAATHAVAINYDEVAPEVSTITVTNDDTKGTYTLTKGDTAVTDGKVNVGDTVKLTVTPNEHFEVKDLTVNGTSVAYVEGGYEFTVSELTYAITINYVGEYLVNYSLLGSSTSSYISMDIQTADGVSVTSGSYIDEGTELSVVITDMTGGYGFKASELYIYTNDTFVNGNDESVVASTTEGSSTYTYKFTTEASETNIYAIVNNSRIDESETGTTGYEIVGVDNEYIKFYGNEEGHSYSPYYPQLSYVKTSAGYRITGLTLEYEDGTTQELTKGSGYGIQEVGTTGFIYLQTTITGNCKISVTGELKDVYDITYDGLENVKLSYGGASFPNSGVEGDIISVSGIVSGVAGLTLSDIEITGVDQETDSNYYVNISNYGSSFRFTMPANAVTIKFVFTENGEMTVTGDEHLTDYTFWNGSSLSSGQEVTDFSPNSTVYVHFEVEEGYLISEIKDQTGKEYELVDRLDQVYYPTPGTVRVTYIVATMPSDGSDLNLTVTTQKASIVTVDESADYDVSFGRYGLSEYVPGTSVTFSGSVRNNLKTLEDIYLEDAEGTKTDVEFSISGSSFSGEFVMPDKDVKFVVALKDIQTYDVPITVVSNVADLDLSEVFGSFSIRNYQSNSYITSYESASTPMKLLDNSSTDASFGINGNYSVSIAYVKTDGTLVPFKLNSVNSYSGMRNFAFAGTTFTSEYTGIKVTIDELEPVTVGFDNTAATDVALTDLAITVNDKAVDTTSGTINLGDSITVKLEKEAESGYAYIVSLVDSEGNDISKDYYGKYTITGDFTIVVEKVAAYKVTFNVDEELSGLYIDLVNSSTYKYYADGDIFTEAFKGYVAISNNRVACDITITVGGQAVATGSIEANGRYQSDRFDANGDVVVTVTVHAE